MISPMLMRVAAATTPLFRHDALRYSPSVIAIANARRVRR